MSWSLWILELALRTCQNCHPANLNLLILSEHAIIRFYSLENIYLAICGKLVFTKAWRIVRKTSEHVAENYTGSTPVKYCFDQKITKKYGQWYSEETLFFEKTKFDYPWKCHSSDLCHFSIQTVKMTSVVNSGLKWGSVSRWSKSVYCSIRSSDDMTSGKTHPSLHCDWRKDKV